MATKKENGIKMDKLPKIGGYTEPSDYIPKSIRKQAGLGEYANKKQTKK